MGVPTLTIICRMIKNKYKHPSVVSVGFNKYTIVQASLKKDDLYGCVDFCTNVLTIDPKQDSMNYRWTLLHEIFHIGYYIFGLGEDEDMPQIGNEFLTTASSNMVMFLWGLNKELFEFIFSEDDNEKN